MVAVFGQIINIGYELEFYLFNSAGNAFEQIIDDCNQSPLFKQNFGEIKKEHGNGQFEIASKIFHSKADCVSNIAEFKNFLLQYSSERRLELIWDSVIMKDEPSSSLQFSVSFNNTDCNSILVLNAIQGILEALKLKSNIDILLPTQDCKQRIIDSRIVKKYLNVPATISWSLNNNRTTAIRLVISKGGIFDFEALKSKQNNVQKTFTSKILNNIVKPRISFENDIKQNLTNSKSNFNIDTSEIEDFLPNYRIEFRVASSISNPDMVLDIIFKGIKHGIKLNLVPSDPIFGNSFDQHYKLQSIA